jgi:hypothetical protein
LMENKRGKSNRTDKKSNRFRSVNSSVRGFETKRDNVIWDHRNAMQWIAAKEILVNKFRNIITITIIIIIITIIIIIIIITIIIIINSTL